MGKKRKRETTQEAEGTTTVDVDEELDVAKEEQAAVLVGPSSPDPELAEALLLTSAPRPKPVKAESPSGVELERVRCAKLVNALRSRCAAGAKVGLRDIDALLVEISYPAVV